MGAESKDLPCNGSFFLANEDFRKMLDHLFPACAFFGGGRVGVVVEVVLGD